MAETEAIKPPGETGFKNLRKNFYYRLLRTTVTTSAPTFTTNKNHSN